MNLVAGVGEFISLGLLLAMLVHGWRLFRAAVALAMGAAVAGVAFLAVVALAVKAGGTLGGSLQTGVFAAVVGFLIGVFVGLRAQQLCAAVGTFTLSATLIAVFAYAFERAQTGSHADPSLAPALLLGALGGGLMAFLVLRLYDLVAAGLMAALVARSFIPGSPGLLESVLEGGDRGGLVGVLTESLRLLSRSIWAALVVPAWIVTWAVVLRAAAWAPRSADETPSLRADWRGALLGTALVVMIDAAMTRALHFAEVVGTYACAWPAMAAVVVYVHRRLRERSASSTVVRYGVHIGLILVAFPLLHAVMLAFVRDLPSFHTEGRRLACLRFLKTYYEAFVSPRVALRGDIDTAAAITFAVSLKWGMNLIVAPALLDGAFMSGSADASVRASDPPNPRHVGIAVAAGLAAFTLALGSNLRKLWGSPERMARAELAGLPLRSRCAAALPTGAQADIAISTLPDEALLRLLFPSYDAGARRVGVSRTTQIVDGEQRTTAQANTCEGSAVPFNVRGAVQSPERVSLGRDRMIVRVLTLSEPAGGSDELTGVLAVVGVQGNQAVVHALGRWTGQLGRLDRARVEHFGGDLVYVLPAFSAGGNDDWQNLEEVWRDQEGALVSLGAYVVETRNSCLWEHLPWDDRVRGTAAFIGETVRVTEEHTFEPGPCLERVPGLRVGVERRVMTRTYALRNGRLSEQGQSPRVAPAPPPAWVEYVRREEGEEAAREIAPSTSVPAITAASPTIAAPSVLAAPSAVVPAAPTALAPNAPSDVVASTWDATAEGVERQEGRSFRFHCPANGGRGTAVGTEVYATMSSVCEAAVHAGALRREVGGVVTIRIGERSRGFAQSTRHGVTSHYSNRRRRTFVFVQ